MEEKYKSDKYFSQLFDNLQSVVELVSRIDERVQNIIEKQREQDVRFNNVLESYQTLLARIIVLESKNGQHLFNEIEQIKKNCRDMELSLSKLEQSNQHMENKWSRVLDFGTKILFVIVACYVVWKLNIPAPSIIP